MRIALDTCAVRSLVHGDERARPLLDLDGLGVRVALGEVTVIELLAQLHHGQVDWHSWRATVPALARLVDAAEPVLQPAGHVSLRRPGARRRQLATLGTSAPPRAIWTRMLSSSSVDDLAEPFETTGASGTPLTVTLDRIRADQLLAAQRERWAAFVEELGPTVARIGEVQRAIKKERSRGLRPAPRDEEFLRMVDEQVIVDGRPHLHGIMGRTFGGEPDRHLDAYRRVTARRLEERARGRYNPRRHGRNDGLDVLQLVLLAIPAILCTTDETLIRVVASTGSTQASMVVTPVALRERLSAVR